MLAGTMFVIQTGETSLSSFRVGLCPLDNFLGALAWTLHPILQLIRDRNQAHERVAGSLAAERGSQRLFRRWNLTTVKLRNHPCADSQNQ